MVKAEHLTKYYGDFLALKDVSFEFGENKVYGLLGPNGAGKSTTMNIMTGCLSATEGRVFIDGHDVYEEPEAAKKLIGYLPEFPPLYVNETPNEYLKFVGEAKGLKRKQLKEQLDQVVSLTGIEDVRNRLISSLSKGYRQRVGIAQALLGDPHVIILDEPTVGLDPLQIIEIRDLIKSLGATHTVILSSHILSEVQMICEEVLIISSGKVAAFGTPEELEKLMLSANAIRLTTDASKEEAERIIRETSEEFTDFDFKEGADDLLLVSIKIGASDIQETEKKLFLSFANAGKTIIEMSAQKANLEDVFIELTESSDSDAEDALSGQTASLAPEGGTELAGPEAAESPANEAANMSESPESDATDASESPEDDAANASETPDENTEYIYVDESPDSTSGDVYPKQDIGTPDGQSPDISTGSDEDAEVIEVTIPDDEESKEEGGTGNVSSF